MHSPNNHHAKNLYDCEWEIDIALVPHEILSQLSGDLDFVQLEDQRGLRSWAFEPHLELNNSHANNELDLLLDTLCQTWLNDFRRKPNIVLQQQFIECLRSILLNLIRMRVNDADMAVGIASGNGRLNTEKRYRPRFMSVSYFRKALSLLSEEGIMTKDAPGYQNGELAQVARYSLTDTGADLLPVSSIMLGDFIRSEPTESIILKDDTKRLIGYKDTARTIAMRSALSRINEVLCAADIGIANQSRMDVGLGCKHVDRNIRLHRIFNNGTFNHGGRYYGGWWQFEGKHTRKHITINGLPTAEADFTGLHAAILFSEFGLTIPDDPYALVPGAQDNAVLRRHAKNTFVALLNAKSTRPEEPSNFDCVAHGMTAAEFRQLVITAYPMLPGVFGSGAGWVLQRQDSELAERIMLHFVDQGVPILPIHDSFIVQLDHITELEAVMRTTFQEQFGQLPKVELNT